MGTWSQYSTVPMITRELRDMGDIGFQFLQQTDPLFRRMSAALAQYAPGVFKQFQLYPLNHLRFCGAWAACVINNGGNNPNQTTPHRDIHEAQYGYSGLLSFGNYTDGALIMYELESIIEMGPGDFLLFPDCLITHANEKAKGVRSSMVTFTQEHIYDYWHHKYNMKLRRKTRVKTKSKIKKK